MFDQDDRVSQVLRKARRYFCISLVVFIHHVIADSSLVARVFSSDPVGVLLFSLA
jgi:hypothetical protein